MITPTLLRSHDPHASVRLKRLHHGVTYFAHSANEANLGLRDTERQVAAIRDRHPHHFDNAGVMVPHILFIAAVIAAAIFQTVAESAPFTDLVISLGWSAWAGKLLPVLVFVVDLYLAERSARDQDESFFGQSVGSAKPLRWVMLLVVTSAVAAGRVAEMEMGDPNWIANTLMAEWVAAAFWVALTIVAHSFILFSGHDLTEAVSFVAVRVRTWQLDKRVRSSNLRFRDCYRRANAALLRYEEARQHYEALHGSGSMPAHGFDHITAAILNSYHSGTTPADGVPQPSSSNSTTNGQLSPAAGADPGVPTVFAFSGNGGASAI